MNENGEPDFPYTRIPSSPSSATDPETLFVQVPGNNPRYLTFRSYSLLVPKPALKDAPARAPATRAPAAPPRAPAPVTPAYNTWIDNTPFPPVGEGTPSIMGRLPPEVLAAVLRIPLSREHYEVSLMRRNAAAAPAEIERASFNSLISPPQESLADPDVIPAAGTDNMLEPDPQAIDRHSTFRRSPDGTIHNYETYEKNSRTGKYDRVLRYRGNGKEHAKVKPPFVLERKASKGPGSTPTQARPARPEEIPKPFNPTSEPSDPELPDVNLPGIFDL
jgi:Bacterial toxin 24